MYYVYSSCLRCLRIFQVPVSCACGDQGVCGVTGVLVSLVPQVLLVSEVSHCRNQDVCGVTDALVSLPQVPLVSLVSLGVSRACGD